MARQTQARRDRSVLDMLRRTPITGYGKEFFGRNVREFQTYGNETDPTTVNYEKGGYGPEYHTPPKHADSASNLRITGRQRDASQYAAYLESRDDPLEYARLSGLSIHGDPSTAPQDVYEMMGMRGDRRGVDVNFTHTSESAIDLWGDYHFRVKGYSDTEVGYIERYEHLARDAYANSFFRW